MKISHNNSEYSLDVDGAIKAGFMKPIRPLKAGDVYVDASGRGGHTSQLLIQAIWGDRCDRDAKIWALLGMGCSPNSNEFFCSLRSLNEIDQYITAKGLIFKNNIRESVLDLKGGF